jgi:hypothetical protein
VIGLIVGLVTYRRARRSRPAVFPVSFRPQRAAASIAQALGSNNPSGELLVVLPHEQLEEEAVIAEAVRAADGRSAVFVYRGNPLPAEYSEMLEVTDPYLRDYSAHDAFARAERLARKRIARRRYVYLPGNLSGEVLRDVWTAIHPKETLVSAGDQAILPPLAVDRLHRHVTDGTTVMHLFTSRVAALPEAATNGPAGPLSHVDKRS